MQKLIVKIGVILGGIALTLIVVFFGLVIVGRQRMVDFHIKELGVSLDFSPTNWWSYARMGWDLVLRRPLQVANLQDDRLLVMERTFNVAKRIEDGQTVLVGKNVEDLIFKSIGGGWLVGQSSKTNKEVKYKVTDYFKVAGRQCISAISQPSVEESINDQVDYSDFSNIDNIMLMFLPGKEWLQKEPAFITRFAEGTKPGDYLKVYVDKGTNEAVAVYLFSKACP